MNLLFWALTVGVVGKTLLAAGVIIAHTELAHEKRINQEVLNGFKLELWLTVVGIILILLGYSMEVYFYGLTPLLTCTGNECSALLLQAVE
jgi:hypothetical protein